MLGLSVTLKVCEICAQNICFVFVYTEESSKNWGPQVVESHVMGFQVTYSSFPIILATRFASWPHMCLVKTKKDNSHEGIHIVFA